VEKLLSNDEDVDQLGVEESGSPTNGDKRESADASKVSMRMSMSLRMRNSWTCALS
jgi:exo-beta-1,3-glucanase (GH17 family)